MKNFFFLLCFLAMTVVSWAQNTFPSSGNVGIGTSSPANLLEIYTGASSRGIQVYGSNFPFIQIQETNYPTVAKWSNADGISSIGTATNHPFIFNTNNVERFRISANGNIGIGTANPSGTLEVGGDKTLSGNDVSSIYTDARVASAVSGGFTALGLRNVGLAGSYTIANAYGLRIHDVAYQTGVTVGKSYGIYVGKTSDPVSGGIVTSNYALVTEPDAGNVGIGTTSPTEKLAVNGKIRAKEINVETGWADFVFDRDYKLPNLKDTEQFIKRNGHLPEIPSAKDVEANGVNLGEMNAKLLQKIEELTLHLIEQSKRSDKQDKLNEELQKEINQLKSKF